MDEKLRIIISGGGTGGHIFPAVSIANAIRAKYPDAEILFVGALGRMEMQRVPAAGYKIVGLPICGFDRKNMLKNVSVLFKIWKSQRMARDVIRKFRPMAAVGVGGYASGPTLNECAKHQALLENNMTKAEALRTFGLDEGKKTVLIVGGSLGARTMNESVLAHLDDIRDSGVQFIWQTGKYYNASINEQLKGRTDLPMLKVMDFISDMGAAYKAADLVISRAGASSISEFCLIGKPVILVPSPNVAEDHQTKNAMALVDKDAALYVSDADAPAQVIGLALKTVKDDARLGSLAVNIRKLGLPDSADVIADEVVRLAREKAKK